MGVISLQALTGNVSNTSGLGLGLTQQTPSILFISTNDTLATVTTAGYLNKAPAEFGIALTNYQMAEVYTTDSGMVWLKVVVTTTSGFTTYSLATPSEGSGSFTTVTLGDGSAAAPSLNFTGRLTTGLYSGAAGEMDVSAAGSKVAAFTSTGLAVTGLISATTTIGAGTNVTAGSASAAGTVTSFPGTANGSLILKAIDAGSAHTTTVSNAASVGQNTVVTIPDPGATTSTFVLNNATAVAGTSAGSWGNATPPTPGHVMTVVIGATTYYVPLVAQNT